MSLPICFWVCVHVVSVPLCSYYPDRCMFADCTAWTWILSGKWDSESASLLSCSLFHTCDHHESCWTPRFSSLNHSLQLSPCCYTDCFEITSSLCALGLNFWPIPIVDFMLIIKQVVSITFLLICLPKLCNIEIVSEESLLCPTLLPDTSLGSCIWHN